MDMLCSTSISQTVCTLPANNLSAVLSKAKSLQNVVFSLAQADAQDGEDHRRQVRVLFRLGQVRYEP